MYHTYDIRPGTWTTVGNLHTQLSLRNARRAHKRGERTGKTGARPRDCKT